MKMVFSLSSLEMILTESQIGLWDQTKNEVIGDLMLTRHRASNDALIIQETYVRTRNKIVNPGGKSVSSG